MNYSVLAETYEKLENVSAKLKKTEILADLFKKTPSDELTKVVLLAQGVVYPKFMQQELGVANQMMMRAISKATGFKQEEIINKFKKTGDLGLVAEECIKSRKQAILLKRGLTTDKVFDNLRRLSSITGEGSQDKKLALVAELLVSASPKEAKYIVRTTLEELRIGVAEGLIRDAIFKAFLYKEGMKKEEKDEIICVIENAWDLHPDYGEIAKIAKERGIKGLKNVRLELGKSIQVMLGEKAESIEDVVKEFGKVIAEYKYDGMRCQIHKKDNKIWVFTRRLEDVTRQFPDIVELSKNGLKTRECIVEGEALAIDSKTGFPLPFQILSQRIQRKYEIEKIMKEIPVQINLFDVVYINGENLFDKPLLQRRKILEKIVRPLKGKFQLTKMIFTDYIKKLEKFYKEALDARQEGLFLKIPSSKYIFGRHVGGWYKIKPIMETLDLVILGATWGEGVRSKWLSSYVLACREPDTGEFLPVGMMGTGLTEEQFEDTTRKLKPLIEKEKGREVEIKPKIVVEVAFQEIQKSPKYKSGLALRFPRLIRIRSDKSADEADTLVRVEKLYKSQGKVG